MPDEFQLDYHLIGVWLRTSPELRDKLKALGERGVEHAKSLAPVGKPPQDKHPGAYRDSINYEIHQGPTRMSVRIGARDQKSHWVEFGAAHTKKRGVLRATGAYLTAN